MSMGQLTHVTTGEAGEAATVRGCRRVVDAGVVKVLTLSREDGGRHLIAFRDQIRTPRNRADGTRGLT